MDFFKIIGILVVGCLVLLVVGGLVVYLVIRGKLKRFAKQVEQMGGLLPPTSIQLNPAQVEWKDRKKYDEARSAFLAAGFIPVNCDYDISPLQGVIAAYYCPVRGAYATYSELGERYFFSDVYAAYEDETVLNVNSAPVSDDAQFDWRRAFRMPKASPAELVAKFDAELGDQPRRAVSAEQFAEVFTAAYERGIKARADQFRADLGSPALGGFVSEEQRLETLRRMHELGQFQDAIDEEQFYIDKFLAMGTVSAREWEEMRGQIVVIGSQNDLDDFLRAIDHLLTSKEMDRFFDEEGELIWTPASGDRFEAVDELLGQIERREKVELLAEFDAPGRARLYRIHR